MSILKTVLMNVATGGFDPTGAALRGMRGRQLEKEAREQRGIENEFKRRGLSVDEGKLGVSRDKYNLDAQLRPVTTAAEFGNAQANIARANLDREKWTREPERAWQEHQLQLQRTMAQKGRDAQAVAESFGEGGMVDPALVVMAEKAARDRDVRQRSRETTVAQSAMTKGFSDREKIRATTSGNPQEAILYRSVLGAENRVRAEYAKMMAQAPKNYIEAEDQRKALSDMQLEINRLEMLRKQMEQSRGGGGAQAPAPTSSWAPPSPAQWQTPRYEDWNPNNDLTLDELLNEMP